MRNETSCGAVVFTQEGDELRFVIIRSITGCYGFPKGHIERGETEQQTALREIKEETGLDVTLIDGFRTTDSYVWARNRRPDIHKNVIYFLGTFQGQTPIPQESEISAVALMRYEDAMAVLPFEGVRRILTEANEFLKQMR